MKETACPVMNHEGGMVDMIVMINTMNVLCFQSVGPKLTLSLGLH